MMFPIWSFYILEVHARCRIEFLFSKDFKTYIYFAILLFKDFIFLKKKLLYGMKEV